MCGFAIYTGDSPNDFDETEDVTDESSSTNDVTAEEIEKVKSAIAKSDNGLAAVAAAAINPSNSKVEPVVGATHEDEAVVQTQQKSPLDGFNVEVKDLAINGKTVRVSTFAGVGVITLSLCFKHAGEKLAPKQKEALVALLASSLGESTESKTSEELETYGRKENISVSFSSNDDNFSINARCPSAKLAELFTLINDMLFHPKFNENDIKRFKEELSASLMQSTQSPEFQLNELIKETVYKNHPYGTTHKTYLDSLKNIGSADLKEFIKSKFTQQNLIISVCGEFEEEKLLKELESFISNLPKNFKAELPKNISVEGPYQIYSKKFPVPQTVLKFLHQGIDHDHPDFFALQIAVGCLSDPFVGLLFNKVRVEKGLVYGIGAGLAIQDHFNAFGVSTFTQTENVTKVIESVNEVFENVSKNGFPPELVENIKKSYIGNYKRSFASSGHIAKRLNSYQLSDRPVDFHKILIEKISALTPNDVSNAFQKFLKLDQFIIFTVGQ